MARTRLIKPDFFHDEDLAELPYEARILFAGLWTIADRAGRLEDRPRRIKAQVLPYDNVDIDALLSRLAASGFIVRYTVESFDVIQIRTFCKHQNPHHREPDSVLPENPNKFEKPRLVRGEAVPIPGRASEQPQPSRAVFDTDTDTDTDPVTDTVNVNAPLTDDGFDAFWRVYPKKKSKSDALKAWRKLKPTPELLARILDAIEAQRLSEDWRRSHGQFIPYPASWLNGQRWLDEGVEVDVGMSETTRHNLLAMQQAEQMIRALDARREP